MGSSFVSLVSCSAADDAKHDRAGDKRKPAANTCPNRQFRCCQAPLPYALEMSKLGSV